MARGWGQRPITALAVVLAAGLAGPVYLLRFIPNAGWFIPLAVLLAVAGAAWLMWGYKARGGFGAALSTAAIAAFIGGALFMATYIVNGLDDGRMMILFLIAVTFAADTGAYITGKAMGSRKMAPNVSPNKTWEGAAGGLLAAVAAGALLGWAMFRFHHIVDDQPNTALVAGAAVGAVLGVTGQLGDLFESKLKRRAGLDDSGVIVPGHGGIMDRLDSMTFNLLAYLPALAAALVITGALPRFAPL